MPKQLSTFKVGDRVVALDNYDGCVKKGETYTVSGVRPATLPERNGLIELNGIRAAIYGMRLELVETKQEETSMTQRIKAGDLVEAIETASGVTKGHKYEVSKIEDREYSKGTLIYTTSGSQAWSSRFKLVEPKQKKQSKKITVDEVQVGDLIVAFRDSYGVETRRKGVVATIEDKPRTKEGNILTHFYTKQNREVVADHIYLLERPQPKVPEIADGTYWVTEVGHKSSPWTVTVKDEKAVWEAADGRTPTVGYAHLLEIQSGKHAEKFPGIKFHTEDPTPKGFDALDKNKTYFLKRKGGGSDYILENLDGNWRYGFAGGDTRVLAEQFEVNFTSGEASWEKPVECVAPPLTDLEKFEQAGYIGPKYHLVDSGLDYKVTAKGNVKNRFSDRSLYTDGWDNMNNRFEWFDSRVKSGDLTEI